MSIPKASFSDLEDAFIDSSYQHHYWLDKRTGEVLFVDEEIARSLERGEDLSNAPKWQREFIEQARRVMRAFGELPGQEDDGEINLERFVEIPKRESRDGYEDMVDFAETVTNPHLRDLLAVALRGKGAFRRFKDVLLGYPAERERWFELESRRERERIEAWAREQDVEIDFERRE
jgi:Uncharacterised protein family (UPF0158)